ncbi:MAG: restriction endonuclease, partial [Nitrospirae bacterium]|nr:restriction endonuclease [Nitrospirota bacterium]
IFPETFPDRGILVGIMAARVIFVFLYGGFVEGQGRFLRPSHVYFFTEEQAKKTTNADRNHWLLVATRPGHRPEGKRWYADTSREPIRDDLMRNQLLRLGIMQKLPGCAVTSSSPINYLSSDFATLFNPGLNGEALAAAAHEWRVKNLDQAILQRMALRAQGIQAKDGDVLIEMPDGTRIRISGGPSSIIIKGLIEDFTAQHMENPAVLWLSASDKKAYPQFVELAASVGLKFNLNAELPDLILADIGKSVSFLFCEVVATDGAITEPRKQALLALLLESNIPISAVQFLSAFEDREASAFRKNFSQLAVDSLAWFRTEPDLLVILSKANRTALDPNK